MIFGGATSLLALIAAGSGAVSPAAGAPRAPMMRVDFDAPAGCSSADAFRRGVAVRLERAAATDGAPAVRIQVHLTRNGDRVVGELRLYHEQAPPDTRTVEGATCDEVVDVLALTAALALQPAARVAPRASSPRAAGAPAAGPRPVPPSGPPRAARESPVVASAAPPIPATQPAENTAPLAPPPPAPTPIVLAPPIVTRAPVPTSPPTSMHVEIGASATFARVLTSAGGAGSGPGPNLGGSVMLGLTYLREDRIARSLRLGWLYLPNDFLLAGGDVVDHWSAFTLTACPGWGLRTGPLDAQVCARGIGGWITASDRAVTNPRSASRSWFSAGALLRGTAALGAGFALELEAEVDAPLVDHQFIITTPLRTVAETPPLSVLVGVGLSRRL